MKFTKYFSSSIIDLLGHVAFQIKDPTRQNAMPQNSCT